MSAKDNFRLSLNSATSVSLSDVFLREETKGKSLFQVQRCILPGRKENILFIFVIFKAF